MAFQEILVWAYPLQPRIHLQNIYSINWPFLHYHLKIHHFQSEVAVKRFLFSAWILRNSKRVCCLSSSLQLGFVRSYTGAGGGCLDIFTLVYPFSSLSPSLWETVRYRLKYCLKGPLNQNNQPTNHLAVACNVNGDVFLYCPFSHEVSWMRS